MQVSSNGSADYGSRIGDEFRVPEIVLWNLLDSPAIPARVNLPCRAGSALLITYFVNSKSYEGERSFAGEESELAVYYGRIEASTGE